MKIILDNRKKTRFDHFIWSSRKKIEEITQTQSSWALNIPDENIFILGLAEGGLYLNDSILEDKRKIPLSNVQKLEKKVQTKSHFKSVSLTPKNISTSFNSDTGDRIELSSVEKNITRNQIAMKDLVDINQSALSKFAINLINYKKAFEQQ